MQPAKPSNGGNLPAGSNPSGEYRGPSRSASARGGAARSPRTTEREISAGIILFRKTREGPVFLILYNGGDYWNFPKGKIQSEERSFEAAVRETEEETGIAMKDLRFLRDFKTHERFVFRRDRRTISKTIIFYVAETRTSDVKLVKKTHGERHQGFGWFPYREATRILGKYRESQRVLKEAYERICAKGPNGGKPDTPRPNSELSRGGRDGGKPPGISSSR